MAILKYILKFFIIAFCVAFVVLNLQDTTFYYSPLATPLIMPLWALGLFLFSIGFICGGLLVWFNQGSKRAEIRTLKKENERLAKEKEELEDEIHPNQEVKETSPLPALDHNI